LVKAEYRYFKSASMAAFCLSPLAAPEEPMPKLAQSEDIPDITLLTLDTEWMDPVSEPRPLGRCDWVRKET
jgi:hypothetical protein